MNYLQIIRSQYLATLEMLKQAIAPAINSPPIKSFAT
jgi:hypothetical protein